MSEEVHILDEEGLLVEVNDLRRDGYFIFTEGRGSGSGIGRTGVSGDGGSVGIEGPPALLGGTKDGSVSEGEDRSGRSYDGNGGPVSGGWRRRRRGHPAMVRGSVEGSMGGRGRVADTAGGGEAAVRAAPCGRRKGRVRLGGRVGAEAEVGRVFGRWGDVPKAFHIVGGEMGAGGSGGGHTRGLGDLGSEAGMRGFEDVGELGG
jgi:hypothetical protein